MTVPETVRAALERASLPLPDPDRVDEIGYTAQEVRAVEREHARLEREYKDRDLDFWALP